MRNTLRLIVSALIATIGTSLLLGIYLVIDTFFSPSLETQNNDIAYISILFIAAAGFYTFIGCISYGVVVYLTLKRYNKDNFPRIILAGGIGGILAALYFQDQNNLELTIMLLLIGMTSSCLCLASLRRLEIES